MMTRVLQAALLFVGFMSLPASACSVHDHSCNFHGMGRVVNPNIDPAAPTAVYIVTEGTTSSDFDNNVLLPDNQGPYVISSTGYPARSDQPYIGTTEQPRHVYPTQYQIDFNNNTAQATHSGDLNGLENIPGATGCQYSSASNCEEVKIVGNIPDTFASDGIGFFVRQTNHLYNAQNVADPSNELQSYAVATGSAFIRTFGHGFVDESGTRTGYNYDSLSATGQQGQENTYYIGYSGFQPHAMGAPVYYNERWSTYGSAYETQLQHKIYTYQDRTNHSQQRFVSGAGEMWTDNYGRSDPIRTLLDVRDVPLQFVYTPGVGNIDRTQNANTISTFNGRIPDAKSADIYWINNPETGKSYPFLNDGAGFKAKLRYTMLVTGGSIDYFGENHNEVLDQTQGYVDNASYIPLVGDVADGANALISTGRAGFSFYQGDANLAQQQILAAGQSGIGLVPIPGVSGGAVKTTTHLAEGGLKYSDEVIDVAKGGTYSLRDPVTGAIMRNGRTIDHAQREYSHGRTFPDLQYVVETTTDNYFEQRGIEQIQLDLQKGPLDKIRGISPQNPNISDYLRAGEDFFNR